MWTVTLNIRFEIWDLRHTTEDTISVSWPCHFLGISGIPMFCRSVPIVNRCCSSQMPSGIWSWIHVHVLLSQVRPAWAENISCELWQLIQSRLFINLIIRLWINLPFNVNYCSWFVERCKIQTIFVQSHLFVIQLADNCPHEKVILVTASPLVKAVTNYQKVRLIIQIILKFCLNCSWL